MNVSEMQAVNNEVPGAFQSMAYPAHIQCSRCGDLFIPMWHGEHNAVIVDHDVNEDCPNYGRKYVIAPFPVHTLELQPLDWIENVRANYYSTSTAKPFNNPLSRKLWGDKVVIIGACPSLDEQKARLPELQKEGYTIVCLMRALPCLADVVDPDIVVIVDPTDQFDNFYQMVRPDTALIADLMASPKLISDWPGPVYGVVPAEEKAFGEELREIALSLHLPRIWTFQLSASFCGIMARIMGIVPVYMGCDMWFTKDQYYAKPYDEPGPKDDEVLPDNRFPGTDRLTSQRFLDKQKAADLIEGYFRINCDKLQEQIVE